LLEHSFEEKISEAEVILLVKVLEVRRDLAGEDGVYSSAALEVLDVIKGDISGSPLQLVMSSAIPAADPKCCKVDSEYLVFARKGATRLVVEDENIRTERVGLDRYISVVNGRFGVFSVEHEYVVDIRLDEKAESIGYQVLRDCVLKVIARQRIGKG